MNGAPPTLSSSTSDKKKKRKRKSNNNKKEKRKRKKSKKKDKCKSKISSVADASANNVAMSDGDKHNKQLSSNNEDYNECKAVMSKYFMHKNDNSNSNSDAGQQQKKQAANNSGGVKSNRKLLQQQQQQQQNKHIRFDSHDDSNSNSNSNDDDDDDKSGDEIMMGDEEDVAKGNNSCWSPMQSEDENEEQQLDTNGDDDDHCKEANNGSMRRKSNNNNNNNNERSVRDKMELARKLAFAKRDEDDDSSSSSGDEDDIYEDTKQPHIKSISSNNPKEEESLEALKQQILGRSITSMYDIDHTAEAALSNQSSFTSNNRQQQQRHIHTTDGTTVANTLRQELSCPICHDRLYNPSSLLCGHTFCMSCLNWWLDRQQQNNSSNRRRGNNDANNNNDNDNDMMNNQSDDESEEEEEWHGTCPTCREPIPPSPSPSSTTAGGLLTTRSNKPNIQVNTALKAVLETLYGNEMNQRRQAEYRQKVKARSGENDGLHIRGYEEIVTLVDEDEKDELSFMKDRLLLIMQDDGGSNREMKKRNNKYEDEENGWVTLHASGDQPGWNDGGYSHGSGSASASIMIRRNIVLDDTDQRYQLSMGLTKCSYSYSTVNTKNANAASAKSQDGSVESENNKRGIQQQHYGVLDIELCLLTMEEDEVDDSGFPTFINEGDDDEALICTADDKVHTCIEAVARVVSLSDINDAAATNKHNEDDEANPFKSTAGGDSALPKVRELSLSRGMIGRDGAVRFRIDLSKALQEEERGSTISGDDDNNGTALLQVVKLKFCHVDTGAALELRLPSSKIGATADGNGSDAEIEFCGTSKSKVAKSDGSRYLLNDEDDEEDSNEPNAYEEDGFVVHGEVDNSEEEEEHNSSDDDEGGECQVCKKGGDLIVCDGGDDRESGCGNVYHIQCIDRDVIPPGDWICQACANGVGLTNVGIEGHEYKEEIDKEDEDDENEVGAATTNNGKTKQLMIDSDEDEIAPLPPNKKNSKRLKRTILDDGDESDSD